MGLIHRQRSISDKLAQRQKQILKLIQTWDVKLEKEIIAQNLYVDESREHLIARVQKIFDKAGIIREVDKIEAWNQLRGTLGYMRKTALSKFTLS